MTDGPRQRSSTAGSAKDGAAVKESGGGGVALKKEIGLVSACGIIIGECHCCCVGMTCGAGCCLTAQRRIFMLNV